MNNRGSIVYIFVLIGIVFSFSCTIFNSEESVPECLRVTGETQDEALSCSNPVFFSRPDWHPGGEWIASQHGYPIDADSNGIVEDLFSGIVLIHSTTGRIVPLLSSGSAPAWSPDGNYLAYVDRGIIYTVRVTSLEEGRIDSSSTLRVTNFNAASNFPTWSATGEWIAFDTNFMDERKANIVWRVSSEGTELTRVTVNNNGGATSPDWSGVGDRIAYTTYTSDGEGGSDVFTMNESGMFTDRLTDSGDNYYPKFSSDGSKVVYVHRSGINSSIWVVNSDGTNKKMLSKEWSSNMTWSPEGNKLVYVMTNHYFDVVGNGQLWIMDADGKNKKQLTSFVLRD